MRTSGEVHHPGLDRAPISEERAQAAPLRLLPRRQGWYRSATLTTRLLEGGYDIGGLQELLGTGT